MRARDEANGPLHLSLQQYIQIQKNNFWVAVGNDTAQAIMFLPAPEAAGAIDPGIEAGLRWGSDNAGNIGRACLLCGTLMTHQPQFLAPVREAPVYGPVIDMVNDLRQWSMRQWQILTRNLPGGD